MTKQFARCASLVAAVAFALAASTAHAIPADQYLKLRRQRGYDPRISYALVKADPSTYEGRIFELRGIVEGYATRDQALSFLLTLPNKDSVCLIAPTSDERTVTDSNRQMLRLLVRAEENATSNLPTLEVLAATSDALVSAREREAVAAAARSTQQESGATVAPRTSASRGYYARRMRGPGSTLGLSVLAQRVLSPEAQGIYPAYKQFIYRCNRRLTADELDSIAVGILYFATRYRVDPRLICAMIIAESDFDPRSTSRKGAMGLGQIMPEEARALHLSNPYDPIENVKGAVDLLRGKLDLYRRERLPDGQYTWDQIILALAAYNAGSGAVRKYGGVPPYRETQGYVKRILKTYRDLCGG